MKFFPKCQKQNSIGLPEKGEMCNFMLFGTTSSNTEASRHHMLHGIQDIVDF